MLQKFDKTKLSIYMYIYHGKLRKNALTWVGYSILRTLVPCGDVNEVILGVTSLPVVTMETKSKI